MQSGRYNVALLRRITNIWFGFNILLVIVNCLPHWPIPFLSWVNMSLYFLAFLMVIYNVKVDEFNWDVFVPFSVLFLLYSVIPIPIIFTGRGFLFGNDLVSWLVYRYYYLVVSFFFVFSIVYYAAKSALQPKKPWILLAATFLFVAAVFLYHFYPLLFNPYIENYNNILYHNKFTYYLLPIIAIFSYVLLNPFFKPKHGEYTHSILSVLTLLSLRELARTITELKNVFVFGTDIIFLVLPLILLNIFLFKRLVFLYSPSGKFYSMILHDAIDVPGLKLEGRDKREFTLFAAIVHYLYSRRHLFIPLVFIFLIFLRIINPPYIVSINLFILAVVVFLTLLFLVTTYNRKQNRDGFIVTQFRN